MKSRKQPRTLQRLILGIVIALICLTWASATRDVLQWAKTYDIAKTAVETNRQVDEILQAGQNLAFERGRTNVLLNAPQAASKENTNFIAERRSAVAKNLEPLLVDEEILNWPISRHVKQEYIELQSLRLEIDGALSKNKIDRDPLLAARWFQTVSNIVDDLGDMAATVSLSDEAYTASFRNFSRMKILAFELRNTLGVESSKIAASVSSNRIMPAIELEEIRNLRGQSTATWNMMKKEAHISRNGTVELSILKVDQEFFAVFRPLQDSVLASFREGSIARIKPEELTAASVPALDSIATFLKVLTDETAKDSRQYLERVRASFALSVSLTLVSLLLGVFAILMVIYRVFIPLKEIGDQLERLAKGDLSVEARAMRRKDEMARGYAVVLAFRDSLVKRSELEAKLIRLSNSDGLTGLANRRCMDDTLEAEWHRAARSGKPVAMAMFDVDFFKAYNDLYGHLVGDECLKVLARILLDHARRPGDLAARYGGEEFVAILPNLTPPQATEWAESVRLEVESKHIPHSGSQIGFVTVSAGVVSMIPARDASVLELLRLADEGLYRAKAEGRNRIISKAGD